MKTLIRNGLIIDGSGTAPFCGDLLIEGDRIAGVFPHAENARPERSPDDTRTLDATGALVTPGFIDAHSHSDAYLVLEPSAASKLAQGVTTEINGQCGGSAVPRHGAARLSSDWASLLGDRLTWRSMAEYRAVLADARPAINTVQFVGHNTLRSSVIGYEPLRATPDSLAAMEKLLARELDDGGWGLTTGLIYQPGKYSNAAEVTALARVAATHGGLYATHMRSEGDRIDEAIAEVLDLVRATGIRAEISHLKTSGKRNWGKIDRVLDTLDDAIAHGLLLGSDRYPFTAAGTDLDVTFPDWAGEGGLARELERLEDPATFARLAAELDASDRDWSAVTVGGTWCDETKPFSGRTVADCCAATRETPGAFVCRTILLDRGRTGGFFFGMSEDNLAKILARPWIVPGSDASLRAPWGPLAADHPHPRAYGTMPRFFRFLTGRLGRPPICTREEAVARMTSVPAARFGIRDRGTLRKGAFADVAVWREDAFAETATYAAPHSFAAGMDAVFVNGVLACERGRFMPERAGRFLERG